MSEEEALGLSLVFLISTVLAYCKGYASGYDAALIRRPYPPPMSKPQKRRPERLKPGLKQLTPYEQRIVAERHIADHKKRWEYLFSLNVFKPTR